MVLQDLSGNQNAGPNEYEKALLSPNYRVRPQFFYIFVIDAGTGFLTVSPQQAVQDILPG